MPYVLGIDLGTTYTAAAVSRGDRTEIVTLGNRAAAVPSVVFLREDETVLTGDAANRRAVTEPGRVAREFKRRVGDPTPLLVGGTPYSAEQLIARLLEWTVAAVTDLEGEAPMHVAISHPANWGDFKKDLLSQAVRLAGLGAVTTLTEPQAAAIHYASQERVDTGDVVAVYDLGGGTFDAAVLRKTADGFEILGSPEGIERLGGIDFDEAMFAFVVRALGGAIEQLDADDPNAATAVARLRQDCVEAKEALSGDTDVAVPVMLPNVQTEVRVTRGEFEDLIRPSLTDSLASMRRALESAGVAAADVKAVLLVGGSSRIPLVGQLVSAEFGRPVAVDAHPKHAVALGAALAAAGAQRGADPAAAAAAAPVVVAAEPDAPASDAPPAPATEPVAAAEPPTEPVAPGHGEPPPGADPPPPGAGEPPPGTVPPGPVPTPEPSDGDENRNRNIYIGVGAAAVVLLIGLAVVLTSGGGGDGGTTAGADGTDPAADAGEDTTSSTSSTTSSTTTTTMQSAFDAAGCDQAVVDAGTDYLCMTSIASDGTNYVIQFEPFNHTPSLAPSPGSLPAGSRHVHFFDDTVAPLNAGTQSSTPGSWVIWDDTRPASIPISSFSGSATRMCALVADNGHAVTQGTGNCLDLPA